MEMTGERRLPASRPQVWRALNDPDILRASIPGCRTLEPMAEPTGDAGYKVTASVKIGPISANFTGQVALRDLQPPSSYRIEGTGQGGPAGFAKGGAHVVLTEDGGETLLSYTVKAEIGGKLAQLGARLIDASAKQMADQFFSNFAAALTAPAPQAAENHPVAAAPPPATVAVIPSLNTVVLGYPLFAWAAAAVFAFVAFSLFSEYL